MAVYKNNNGVAELYATVGGSGGGGSGRYFDAHNYLTFTDTTFASAVVSFSANAMVAGSVTTLVVNALCKSTDTTIANPNSIFKRVTVGDDNDAAIAPLRNYGTFFLTYKNGDGDWVNSLATYGSSNARIWDTLTPITIQANSSLIMYIVFVNQVS